MVHDQHENVFIAKRSVRVGGGRHLFRDMQLRDAELGPGRVQEQLRDGTNHVLCFGGILAAHSVRDW